MIKPFLIQREFVKAEEYSRNGIEIYLKSHHVVGSDFHEYYYQRALALEGLELYDEALKHAKKAVEIAKQNCKPFEDYEKTIQRIKTHV